jgi:hypothetical protein
VVPHQKFNSFAVAEEEPSDGAKRLAAYDSSQVVLVHKQCLMRSRAAQYLVRRANAAGQPVWGLHRLNICCRLVADGSLNQKRAHW